MHQNMEKIRIIKLINGDDIVCSMPKEQLPESHNLIRLEKPLLVKYVPQMTITGIKDYVALVKWAAYTPDTIVTIPKDKIMTITNASIEMTSSYINVSKTHEDRPLPPKQERYNTQRLTDEENEKLNEIFDDYDDEGGSTIH